jgi:hypothetical protein
LITLSQSLGVVYAANICTTMTGWLISVIGFGVKIEAFALPLVAGAAVPRKKGQGVNPASRPCGFAVALRASLDPGFSPCKVLGIAAPDTARTVNQGREAGLRGPCISNPPCY